MRAIIVWIGIVLLQETFSSPLPSTTSAVMVLGHKFTVPTSKDGAGSPIASKVASNSVASKVTGAPKQGMATGASMSSKSSTSKKMDKAPHDPTANNKKLSADAKTKSPLAANDAATSLTATPPDGVENDTNWVNVCNLQNYDFATPWKTSGADKWLDKYSSDNSNGNGMF